jgi:hypothetical protein
MAETKIKGRKGTVRRSKHPTAPNRGPSTGPAKAPAIPEIRPKSRSIQWDPNDPSGHAPIKKSRDPRPAPKEPHMLKEARLKLDELLEQDEEMHEPPPQGLPGTSKEPFQRPFIPHGIAVVKLTPEHKHIINLMARYGATVREIAHELNLSEAQLRSIAFLDREIIEELKVGREFADARVEEALYRRATGYTYDSEKIFCVLGRIVRAPVIEHIPPDVEACKFWLKARKEQWRAGDGRPEGDGDPVSSVTIVVESARKDPSKKVLADKVE